jgi:hypothetical protein
MGCLYFWHNKIFQIHVIFLFYHKKDIAKGLNASAAAAAAAGTRILTMAILEYILIIARFYACNLRQATNFQTFDAAVTLTSVYGDIALDAGRL